MAEKEYIERAAAVGALLELRKTYRLLPERCAVQSCILQIRDEQPAADVVEVVRCKDCAYASERGITCHYGNGHYTSPMRYCSEGERKGD